MFPATIDRFRTPAIALMSAGILVGAAGAAAADTIGLWFDPGYEQARLDGQSVPAQGELYLVLHDPSVAGVGGWECRFAVDGPGAFLDWTLEGLAYNFETPPSFTVGLGAPLPGGPDVLLATATYTITGPGPVTFSLLPTVHPSLPGQMAYIDFADPNRLLPMATSSGTSAVAWFNGEGPACEVDPPALEFGGQPIGVEALRIVSVHNGGGDPLMVAPSIAADCTTFRIASGGGATELAPGEDLAVVVGYTAAAGVIDSCSLDLGTGCPAVPLGGSGRSPMIRCTLSRTWVDFGAITVGKEIYTHVTVANVGDLDVDFHVQTGADCGPFIFRPTDFTVAAGTAGSLLVGFKPHAAGRDTCTVTMSEYVPALVVSGEARATTLSWNVSPTAVDFGTVGMWSGSVVRTVAVHNTGEVPFHIAPSLGASDPAFSIVSPQTTSVLLNPGAYVPVKIAFAPSDPGVHSGSLFIAPGIAPVPLTATVPEGLPTCRPSTTVLDFGTVAVGNQVSLPVRVDNPGAAAMTLDAATDSPAYTVTSAPRTIAAGGSGYVFVSFRPAGVGGFPGTLSLGPTFCEPIDCAGIGRSGPWNEGSDLIAVTFAPDAFLNEIDGTMEPLDAWLVLVNPSHAQGVWGWEVALDYDPSLVLVSSEMAGGSPNVLTPPNFLVDLSAPLPSAPVQVLAHLVFWSEDADRHGISVGPVLGYATSGSSASWIYNSAYERAPMGPITGVPEVATINAGGTGVAVQAPTPTARLVDGRVALAWPVPAGGAVGCHVYRKVGPDETRLTDVPLRPGADGYTYSDDLAGLPGGATVAYSYALVADGVEFARSLAAVIETPPAAPLTNGLLPNRPNPFNPETEIGFTVASRGPVRVVVYDATGRRIAVLVDGYREAGPGRVTWHGRDDAGRPVPSGVYYVRLQTVTGQDTRKITLLK